MKKSRQNRPVSALDVAAYILANHTKNTPIDAWKMHKLVYFCQVWSLKRDGLPFFYEKILASPNGIVIKELCAQHYDHLYIGGSTIGNLNHLSLKQVDTIDYVMKNYGSKSLEELDALIRQESPWKVARGNLDPNDKRSVEITLESLNQF